jgi:uncharacterized protein (TIGR02099 family)
VKLILRQRDDHWQVEGLAGAGSNKLSFDSSSYSPVLAWILSQQKILIKDFSAQVFWQDGSEMALRRLDVKVVKQAGRYRIMGRAFLDQTPPTSFRLIADMDLNPYAIHKASGDVYIATKMAQLTQWQRFFPKSRFAFQQGYGDIKLWLTWRKGKVVNAQSQVAMNQLAWTDSITHQTQSLPRLRVTVDWNTLKTGWQLTVTNLRFLLNDTVWPKNKILVQYQEAVKTFNIYIQHILLESLSSSQSLWPDAMSSKIRALLTSHKPQGNLYDTQLLLKQGNVQDVLTNFNNLSWQPQPHYPGVDNLTGVIHWSPEQGRLALDSRQIILKDKLNPPITFSLLNTSMEWKKMSHGFQVSMDRFLLKHPDLIVTGSGSVDDLTADSAGQLDLSAQISATQAQRWLAYLPTGLLKPKLEAWFKQDVKNIDSLSADIRVHGLASDFPFDNRPGEFLIKSYVRGVDLIFAPGWPIAKAIDAFIRIENRLFDADIEHADLQGTILNQANLRITDLGLNHETLLLHTLVDPQADKALSYILSSPLRKKLSTLSMLSMQGDFNLDLQLEVPLYPENDEVLTLGKIKLHNNKVDINYSLNTAQLDNLNGSLQFDQKGVQGSNLQARFMDYPIDLSIQTLSKPTPSTQITMSGKVTIDSLRKQFNLPILSMMHGELGVTGLLNLTDAPDDMDSIRLTSPLVGVAIDLPQPLGKASEIKAPLSLTIDFNPKKAMRLRTDYDNRLTSDLWFAGGKNSFQLQKGTIRLGNKPLSHPNQAGVQILGELDHVDVRPWLDVFSNLSLASNEKGIKDALSFIDLVIKKITFGNQQYQNTAIKALKLPGNDWSINLNQAFIRGNLRYRPSTNTLSGVFHKFQIEKQKSTGPKEISIQSKPDSIKAKEMPNLDLQVNGLQYGDLSLGDAYIKATTLPHSWRLDYGKITSPVYQFAAKGQWNQENKINATTLDATLTITDLAKTLERWNISPVVEAKFGSLQFQGRWPGSFQDFSLAGVSGRATIAFKNGRITHLSPETEEKLGLGKLLSILSLQTIPRRLKLDFSDLSHKGYSFDKFHGNFAIAHGLMSTQDSYIDGPIAFASMKGSLDIAKQLYDLDLRISPHVTASLPVVATIAGGPIVGIAAWVASKIINKGMQKISGYTYKISGPWKQPVVQQVSIIHP